MYFENNRSISLVRGWTAEFIFRYEVKMGINGWGLVLHGPNGIRIERFKDYFCGCWKEPKECSDSEFAKLLGITDDGNFMEINTAYDGRWVVALAAGTMCKVIE